MPPPSTEERFLEAVVAGCVAKSDNDDNDDDDNDDADESSSSMRAPSGVGGGEAAGNGLHARRQQAGAGKAFDRPQEITPDSALRRRIQAKNGARVSVRPPLYSLL